MGQQCSKCFDVQNNDEPLNEMFIKTNDRIGQSDDTIVKQHPAPQPKVEHLVSEQSLPDLPRIDQLQSKLIKDSHINTTFNRRLTSNEGLYATVSDKKQPIIIELDDETPEEQIVYTDQREIDSLSPNQARGSFDGENYQPEFLFRGKGARNSQQQ